MQLLHTASSLSLELTHIVLSVLLLRMGRTSSIKPLLCTEKIEKEYAVFIFPYQAQCPFIHIARTPAPDSVLLEVFTIAMSRTSRLRKRFGKIPF